MDINVKDIINSDTALAPSTGDPVHNVIKDALMNKNIVNLDFRGIEIMTTAFLNAAIGKLYSEFDSAYLNSYLKVAYISPTDLSLLVKVIQTAKNYFANPDSFNDNIRNHFENE
jgi:hypothetical protein